MPALAAPPQLPPPSRTPQLGCEPWVEGGLTPEQLAAGTDKRGEICHLCAEAPQKTSAPGGGKTGALTGEGRCRLLERLDPICFELTFNLAWPGHREPKIVLPALRLDGFPGGFIHGAGERCTATQSEHHSPCLHLA